jgi:hypothetical protein
MHADLWSPSFLDRAVDDILELEQVGCRLTKESHLRTRAGARLRLHFVVLQSFRRGSQAFLWMVHVVESQHLACRLTIMR